MKMKYFRSSYLVTVVGLIGGGALGYWYGGSWGAVASSIFLTAILAVLEVSLSFDNAVVNATVLKRMTPEWRHRFITWGILIAVFGMRIVFPLAIVSILAEISPWSALVLASSKPDEYAMIMKQSHLALAGFGGAFLLMVSLKYFLDANKDVHWVRAVEKPLAALGKIESIEIAFCLIVLYIFARNLDLAESNQFLISGVAGLVTFLIVDGVSSLLEHSEASAASASVGLFVYLEILDASFSFDGVIGAFALTHNLFIIAIGLGIGAMFVRSLTILFVEEETLTAFRYLEHGAFYAIGALAAIMLLGSKHHLPEVVTGLIGAGFIGLAFLSSVRYNRRQLNR